MVDFYILDDNDNPVEELDDLKWLEWRARYESSIAVTFIARVGGNVEARRIEDDERVSGNPEFLSVTDEIDKPRPLVAVSTIFLGLNHRYFGDGPPLLFETMVFGGELDKELERYETKAQALVGHDEMVARVLVAKLEKPKEEEEDAV
jgi:hypothetical protein